MRRYVVDGGYAMKSNADGEDRRFESLSFMKDNPFEYACVIAGMGCGGLGIVLLFFTDFWRGANADLSPFSFEALCFAGVILGCFAAMVFSRFANNVSKLIAPWGVSVVSMLIGLLVFPRMLGASFFAFAWALLMSLWSVYLFRRKTGSISLAMGLIVAGIVAFCVGLSSLKPSVFLLAASLAVSAFLFVAVVMLMGSRSDLSVAHETQWKAFFKTEHFLFMRFLDVSMGICLVSLIDSHCLGSAEIFLLAAGAILTSGLTVLLVSEVGWFTRRKAILATFLCCVVASAFLLDASSLSGAICATILFAVSVSYRSLNSLNYAHSLIVKPFSELFYFGTTGLFCGFGIALGFVVAGVSVEYFPEAYRVIVDAVVVATLAVSFAMIGCYGTKESYATRDPNALWFEKVLLVSKNHGLTQRQTDVLHALSRGRNARFIEERYCLSSGTVKTHIRAVYNKLGVHSQQELMDMVKDAETND